MPAPAQTLKQATQRVKAMRREGLSIAKIAAAARITEIGVHTILKKGAAKTRGKNKRALVAWMERGEGAKAAPAAAAKTVSRRRRRRAGREATSAPVQAVSRHATITLDNGATVRLTVGQRYFLREGQLFQAL